MNQERSVKVIPFRGLDREWREWSAKFLAKANLQGFNGILLGDVPVPPENIENRIQKDEIAREYNMYAYSSLILCCTGVPFSIVDGAKTVELPSGDARLAWEALKEGYQVETTASKVDLKRQFAESKLSYGQDPDEWMMNLD